MTVRPTEAPTAAHGIAATLRTTARTKRRASRTRSRSSSSKALSLRGSEIVYPQLLHPHQSSVVTQDGGPSDLIGSFMHSTLDDAGFRQAGSDARAHPAE